MGLVSILTAFLVATALFFWMGRRFFRIGATVLLGVIALAAYAYTVPASADLNEADRIGNAAARLIAMMLAASSAIAFCAGYILSIWARLKNRRKQVGAE